MTILKLFLSPQVDVPDEVLQAAGKRLKQYFDLICINQRPRKFLSSTFKIAPHAGEVTDVDLVAYITQGSLIINLMDKVYEPGVDHSNMLHGHAGGGTAKMPDGRVLSEVYWTGGLNNLKTSTSDRRGIALANLIFHEWAHNKHTSDPKALSNGEGANGSHVHFFCGGGSLQLGLSSDLIGRKAPEHSIPGIILACASLVVMPVLSRAKRRVGNELGSAAMHTDAKQTDFCVYLSAILLAGLLLNVTLGWWWADPFAALVMVPIIAKEGVDGIRARACCD